MTNRMIMLAAIGAMLFAPLAAAAQDRGYPGGDDRGRDDRGRDDRGRDDRDRGYPAGGGYPGGQQIRCESWQFQPARCPTGGGGRAQLVQVIAGNCIEGRTWGSDRGGIWVNGGCRAVFATGGFAGPGGGYGGGGYGGGQPVEVVCQSWQYQPASCPVGPARRADVVELLGGNCIQGRTWGMDRGAIWVNGGCRARFRAY